MISTRKFNKKCTHNKKLYIKRTRNKPTKNKHKKYYGGDSETGNSKTKTSLIPRHIMIKKIGEIISSHNITEYYEIVDSKRPESGVSKICIHFTVINVGNNYSSISNNILDISKIQCFVLYIYIANCIFDRLIDMPRRIEDSNLKKCTNLLLLNIYKFIKHEDSLDYDEYLTYYNDLKEELQNIERLKGLEGNLQELEGLKPLDDPNKKLEFKVMFNELKDLANRFSYVNNIIQGTRKNEILLDSLLIEDLKYKHSMYNLPVSGYIDHNKGLILVNMYYHIMKEIYILMEGFISNYRPNEKTDNYTLDKIEVENELVKELNKANITMEIEEDLVYKVMQWSIDALAFAEYAIIPSVVNARNKARKKSRKTAKKSAIITESSENKKKTSRKSPDSVASKTTNKDTKSQDVVASNVVVRNMVNNVISNILNKTSGRWQNINRVLNGMLKAGQEYAAEAAYRYAHIDEIDIDKGRYKPFRQYPGRALFLSKFAAKMARKKIKRQVIVERLSLPYDIVFKIAEMVVSDSDDDNEANEAAKRAWAKINVETSFKINRNMINIIIQEAITNYMNKHKKSGNSSNNNLQSEWNKWWKYAVEKINTHCDEIIREIRESTKPAQEVARQILSEINNRTLTTDEKDAFCKYALNEASVHCKSIWNNLHKKI